MASHQHHARNVQIGAAPAQAKKNVNNRVKQRRVSGGTDMFGHIQPRYNNPVLHPPGHIPTDDVDANADATTHAPIKMDTSTNMTASRSSPATAGTGTVSVCPACKRTFKRRCDLNRHRRTHTRPFKCQMPNCEYSRRGFPTSQELQRHMDDRHSDKPPTFHCSFEGCNYSSKRESNCKQHMEKTHGWTYDRSRHNNGSNAAARANSNDNIAHDHEYGSEIDAAAAAATAAAANADADADADGETESVQTKHKEEYGDDDEVAHNYAMPALAASSTLSPTGEDYALHQQQLLQYQQLQQFNNSLSHASSPMPMMSGEADFILYPDNQPQQITLGSGATAALAADGSVVYTTTDTLTTSAAAANLGAANASPAADAISNSYVPWESPLTQQEEISNLIRTTSRRFDMQSQQQKMHTQTPPARPLAHAQAQRVPVASVYPQAIGYFAPANYHTSQVPLPTSVPGSTAPSAAAAGDYAAAFSPSTPFMGTPHAFQHQQSAAYISPQTPLVGVPTLFTQAWPALLSTTTAQTQQQLHVFAEQTAALRQQARAKAEAVEAAQAPSPAKMMPMTQEIATAAAGERGIKRDHDTYQRDTNNTANEDNTHGHNDDSGGDDDDEEMDGNDGQPPHPPQDVHNNADNFDDDHMPCPYHQTDPGYYYRDNEERFSPCHTQHRYISTLFRHLGRAAHNLIITENSASSFGVRESGNRPQLQAGLCRRCWTSFTDQAAFNTHVEMGRPCARASRSKREKYSQILRTFCTPRPETTTAAPAPGTRPATPAPTAPGPRAVQLARQPAASIEDNAGRLVPPQVQVQVGQAQVAPTVAASAAGATADPRSPDVKVSPTQQEVQARSKILADCNPNRNQFPVQGRAHPLHKHNNSVESSTLADADFYVSRTEFQGFTQSVTQKISALEALVQQIGTGVGSAIAPATTRAAASSSSTHPPSSLGPGPARSVISAIQTDAGAHERGSLVREMDRQTILEEDDNADDTSCSNRRRHRQTHLGHQSQESRASMPVAALDANQMLAGIGEPLRTLSGLSSTSDGSSVLHVPPPASVSEDNSRSRQRRQQQQQAQGGLPGDIRRPQQLVRQLEQLGQQGEQQQAQPVGRQRHHNEEAETLPDTAPETVADSGYVSSDNKNPHHQNRSDYSAMGTLPVVHEVAAPTASFGSLLGLAAKDVDDENNPVNADIDDGVQPPSMFDAEHRDDFDETDVLW
ncbi:hypothetical protein SPBR_02214 [Sporothrix brasiliensis 5110]|uniref:C2H2-type domain-containing protein n=1 Tax=Sporothrix brasiliensis 5110 TaxID=1398154 RepID=A0A0C2IV17_9PEZI|nr:uncharacterized protein SPBR_02214 [Sporothrix brasiliensis 5110]KIH92996.1 hypothetical protein SPBR_02214 [Sporothrix brasiliensis 5110]